MFLTILFIAMALVEFWIANRKKQQSPEVYYTHTCGGIGFLFLAGMIMTTWILFVFPAALFFFFSLFYESRQGKSRD
mgnify:CR=1 FL=1